MPLYKQHGTFSFEENKISFHMYCLSTAGVFKLEMKLKSPFFLDESVPSLFTAETDGSLRVDSFRWQEQRAFPTAHCWEICTGWVS